MFSRYFAEIPDAECRQAVCEIMLRMQGLSLLGIRRVTLPSQDRISINGVLPDLSSESPARPRRRHRPGRHRPSRRSAICYKILTDWSRKPSSMRAVWRGTSLPTTLGAMHS